MANSIEPFSQIVGVDWSGSNSAWGYHQDPQPVVATRQIKTWLSDLHLLTQQSDLRPGVVKRLSDDIQRLSVLSSQVQHANLAASEEHWRAFVSRGLPKAVALGQAKFGASLIPDAVRAALLPIVDFAVSIAPIDRRQIVAKLRDVFSQTKRTAVIVDAGLGYPDWFYRVLNVNGIDELAQYMSQRFHASENPRDALRSINDDLDQPAFCLGDRDRYQEYQNFTQLGQSAFRMVETRVVAKSAFFFHQHAVAGHTISCLAALHELKDLREQIHVWPHDGALQPGKHLLVEGFPSFYGKKTTDAGDAMLMCDFFRDTFASQQSQLLQTATADVRREGWIYGVPHMPVA